MDYLIVAHPDDEVVFFNPENYDKIIIVFMDRLDSKEITEGRHRVKKLHPLKDKITWLEYHESNFWRDERMEVIYKGQYSNLCFVLSKINDATSVTTHAFNGEYGHADHVLVHKAVVDTFDKNIVKFGDISIKEKIKELYKNEGCWTWKN